MLSIGLMSGTSMDGIDVALLDTDGEDQLMALGHTTLRYSNEVRWLLKGAERAVHTAKGHMARAHQFYIRGLQHYLSSELNQTPEQIHHTLLDLTQTIQSTLSNQCTQPCLSLDNVIKLSTQLHAEAVYQLLDITHRDAASIDVIGYHGQTLYHNPAQSCTIQIGNGQQLSDLTGITVINRFREQDIAAGGCGAPFAPIYHLALAKRDGHIPLVVVNCGGIANLTVIRDTHIENLIGFDTGPGNGLIDALVKQRTQGAQSMDANGQYGLNGQVDARVLHALYTRTMPKKRHYFRLKPPKALDIRDMVLIPELNTLSLEDACATLEAFTAQTIVDSLQLLSIPPETIPRHWILAGGGWYNPVIRNTLAALLNKTLGDSVHVETASTINWHNDAMEAQIFAYFAPRCLRNLPLSVPKTTGVATPLSGGTVHRPSTRSHVVESN